MISRAEVHQVVCDLCGTGGGSAGSDEGAIAVAVDNDGWLHAQTLVHKTPVDVLACRRHTAEDARHFLIRALADAITDTVEAAQ